MWNRLYWIIQSKSIYFDCAPEKKRTMNDFKYDVDSSLFQVDMFNVSFFPSLFTRYFRIPMIVFVALSAAIPVSMQSFGKKKFWASNIGVKRIVDAWALKCIKFHSSFLLASYCTNCIEMKTLSIRSIFRFVEIFIGQWPEMM